MRGKHTSCYVSIVLAFLLLVTESAALAMEVTKIKLSTMSVGPIELFSDNRGHAKLISVFGTVVITSDHHSFGYNDTNKSYIEYLSPEEFSKSKFVTFLNQCHSPESYYKPWTKLDAYNKNGWPLTRFRRTFLEQQINKSPRVLSQYSEVVSSSNSLALPYEWVVPYVTALGVPCPPNGFPLFYYAYVGTRTVQKRLELISITKEQVPGDFFSAPQGYKLARDDVEVFLGGSNFSELFFKLHGKSTDFTKANQ
jgi:hypothetical protein